MKKVFLDTNVVLDYYLDREGFSLSLIHIFFKQKVDTVYIYASRPISKIVGEFKIAEIICDTPV